MVSFIIRTVICAAGLFLIAQFSGGHIVIGSFGTALLAALLLGVANAVVKPVLQAIAGALTCALSIITLGLWSVILSWLLNGLLFYAVSNIIGGFEVKGYLAALAGALALSIINAIAGALTGNRRQEKE